MKIKALQTFQVVAEELNLSKAAIKLNYSQPTVTKHIQYLEEELQTVLLVRGEGKYQLTKSGHELYARSLKIIHELKAIEEIAIHGSGVQQLKLQGHDYYCYEYFMPAIKKMRAAYPGVKYSLIGSNNQDTVGKLLKGEIDVGIISGNMLPNDFKSVQIGEEKVGVCVNHTIFQEEYTTNDYLAKYPLVIDETEYYKSDNIFPFLNKPIDIINTTSDEVVHEAILRHKTVGIVRLGRMAEDIDQERIKIVETLVVRDPVYLVINKNVRDNVVLAFYDITTEIANPRSKYRVRWV